MPDAAGYRYAELHLHLGGAILPRVLWSYLQRERAVDPGGEFARDSQALVDEFGEYADFERFLTRDCATLAEYLEAHKRVEPLQKVDSLPYYVYRLLRGAAVFENIAYIELRYNPYFRIPRDTPPRPSPRPDGGGRLHRRRRRAQRGSAAFRSPSPRSSVWTLGSPTRLNRDDRRPRGRYARTRSAPSIWRVPTSRTPARSERLRSRPSSDAKEAGAEDHRPPLRDPAGGDP